MKKGTSLRSIITILIVLVGVLTPLASTVFPPATFGQAYPTIPSFTSTTGGYNPAYPGGSCDKRITKSMSPNPVVSGGTATVTITITNTGTGTCPAQSNLSPWTMEDQLPAGMMPTQSSLTITPSDGWSVYCWPGSPVPGSPSNECAEVDLAFAYTMAPGYSVTITFQVEITAASGTLQNCAWLSSWNGVPGQGTDTCATITVVPSSVTAVTQPVTTVIPTIIPTYAGTCQRQITKTMSPNPVVSGGTVTVTLTLSNVGTGTCPMPHSSGIGWSLVDVEPAGMVPTESSLTINGNPAPSAGWSVGCWTYTCAYVYLTYAPDTIPAGYTVTISFQAQITAASGTLQNCANILGPGANMPGPLKSCATVTVVPSSATTSSGVGVASGFTLPVVGANGVTGQTVTLSSFQGKVVLLEFLEPWSPHCQSMAPVLNSLYTQYSSGNVVFLTVAGSWQGATASDVANFISQYGTSWTYVYDSSGTVFSNYGVNSVPTFYIIGTNGSVASTFVGEQTAAALSGAISSAGGT